jgi:hypothetical protein
MTRGNYAVRRGSLVSHNHEQVTRAVDDQTMWRNCSRGSTAFMARGKELLAAERGGRATEAGRQAKTGAGAERETGRCHGEQQGASTERGATGRNARAGAQGDGRPMLGQSTAGEMEGVSLGAEHGLQSGGQRLRTRAAD